MPQCQLHDAYASTHLPVSQMKVYCSDAEVEQLEAALPGASGEERLGLLVNLSWAIRQRDSKRAVSLADEVDANLSRDASGTAQKMRCRLALVRAEVAALFGHFDQAEAELERAHTLLASTPDAILQGDRLLVTATLCVESGQAEREFSSYQEASEAFAPSGDEERLAIAEAWSISRLSIDDPPLAHRRADDLELRMVGLNLPAVTCLIGTARFRHVYSSHPAKAIAICVEVCDLALSLGMVRMFIVYRFNIGMSMLNMGEMENSAGWLEQGLNRARQAAWPAQIGLGRCLLGNLARQRGDLERARSLLSEAIQQYSPTSSSINKVMAYSDLGNVLIEMEHFDEAKAALETAIQLSRRGRQTLNFLSVLIVYARALSKAGDPRRALEVIEEARELIERFSVSTTEMELNQALAEIYQSHPEHAGDKGDWPNAVIAVLEKAYAIGQGMAGWKRDLVLLLSLRDAWTHEGDLQRALEYSNLAFERERELGRETTAGRLAFVEARHEIERARAESEHHQQLAATADETSRTLDQLGRIGQEITASLNSQRVFHALYRNLGNLLDAPTLSVFLLEPDQLSLTLRFGMEDDTPLPERRIPLDSPNSNAARCIRERSEVLMLGQGEYIAPSRAHIPGTRVMRTALFGPLIVGDRVLGALSIQSDREDAYQERERLIFRTLCAYGAIALDNADAYRQLQAAQQRIVLQEKMAGLGTLTAGVAHEINNPANFAHAGAQLLNEETTRLKLFLLAIAGDDADPEILEEIGSRFDGLTGHIDTIREGTGRIRDLVKDLRTFSRLDEAARKAVRLSDSLNATLNLVRTQYAEIAAFELDMQADPLIECWPALLNQVFMNLIVNACQAIKARFPQSATRHGLITIKSWLDGSMLALEFADNGTGMSRDTLNHVFEPFFTTKTVGEGTGLGMSISFEIIDKHQGTIEADSVEGEGSRFILRLPLEPATALA